MNRIMKGVLVAAIALGSTQTLLAQEQNSDNLYDMSLEDLLDYAVVSATKSEVNVRKAPSVVRVFTQKDFQEYGFTSLQQVMENIPGVQVQQYRAGHQLAWVRGVQARYNNKVLMLVDGVPMRDGFYGNVTFDEMLPLEMIDKVEVLNGPGSVLYGANSFSGVINIVTKKEGKSVGARYGSFNTRKAYAEASHKNLYGNVSYIKSEGFQPTYMVDGNSRQVDQEVQGLTGMLKFQRNKLSVVGGFSNYHHPYTYRSTDKQYSFDRKPLYGGIAYSFDLGERAKLNTSAFINRYNFNRNKIKYTGADTDEIKETAIESLHAVMEGVEASYVNSFGKNQVTAGLSLFRDRSIDMTEEITYSIKGPDKLGTENILVSDGIKRSNIGLYIQDVFSISDNLSLTSGIRYEVLSDFNNQFNYRLALTGQEGNFYGKLMYGTAYRVPSYREYLTIDAPNTELQPEHLATLEGQIGYKLGIGDVNLTLYHNQYTNFIGEVAVDSIGQAGNYIEIDDEMAFNFDERKITGAELSSVFMINSRLVLNYGAGFILNATEKMGALPANIYHHQDITPQESPIYFLSKVSSNLLATYKFSKAFKLGTNLIYNNGRNTPSDYQAKVPDAVKNAANANGFVRVDMHTTIMPTDKLRIKARAQNMLNSDIYSPPYGGSQGYDAEWPGRTFNIEVNYKF